MIQTLIVVLLSLIGNGDITVAELYELERLDSTHHYYGDNWEFEDGSFIRTINEETISGCMPFMLCSWVGVDTPWEDFLTAEDSATMYKLVRFYKTYRNATAIFH